MAKVKRLSKVARELNVGINTIVEFLADNGQEIDANPNTKLNPELYEMLLSEFQSEKSAKEASQAVADTKKVEHEKVSLHEDQDNSAPTKKEEEEVLIKNLGSSSVTEKEEEPPAKKDVKVVGKIDLDSVKDKKKKEAVDKKKKEEEDRKAQKAEAEKKQKASEDASPAKEKSEEPKEREEVKIEIEKLDGPKVLGKIDLPKKKEKKKEPVASSDDKDANRKKRRKRIQKVQVDTNSPASKRRKGKKQKEKKPELTEEEIQKEIKETLARLTTSNKSKAAKYRRQKRDAASEQMQKEAEEKELEKGILKLTEFVTVSELASMMDVDVNEVIAACMSLGLFVSINQRLDAETLSIVAEEFGFDIDFVSAEEQEDIIEEEENPENLEERYPIITVMGHVDHGKTSLLDYIRSANVIAGEAGGITQHIGAYNVKLEDGRHITFLDTPGHEAFTAMRARGAQVTDVAIIVIAADDSVMPQTKEAINHAQAAGVPIVFAFNKIDKPGANADKVREELSTMNILVEDWGGKYQAQEISAKTGQGIPELLDKVLLEAEMLELKANPKKNAAGVVIESSLDKGRGYVVTLLVRSGTLRIGDIILAGCYSGRVKAMFNERGQNVKEAGPSIPVTILGLNGAPNAGDKFNVMDDEREARNIADKRLQLQREQGVRTKKHITLDEIGRRIAIGDFQELNVIIKGDVDGSIEALADSLQKLSTENIQVNIIHKSVGQITESDVMLAAASDALIVGFQVRPSAGARKLAETEQIDIRLYSIIYDAIEEVKSAMEGMLKPKVEENVVGVAEVRDVFKISKIGTVAGCMVTEGKLNRNNKVRLIRDGVVVYEGELGSLKRFKEDAKEVQSGYECGLNIEKFNDIKVGDVIEAFEEVEVKQSL